MRPRSSTETISAAELVHVTADRSSGAPARSNGLNPIVEPMIRVGVSGNSRIAATGSLIASELQFMAISIKGRILPDTFLRADSSLDTRDDVRTRFAMNQMYRMPCASLRVIVPTLVLFAASGCEEMAAPRLPSGVVANSATSLTDTVGLQVSPPPSIKVEDAAGLAVPGVPVTFAITAGGGTTVGGSALTDATGVASIVSWRLGPARGVQALTATVDGLAPVVFQAKALAGSPYSIRRIAGDGQTVTAGMPVPVRPSVLLLDLYGNAVSDVVVTFEGDGVSGGTQVTDESGIATVGGWAPRGAGFASLEVRSGFLFNRFTVTIR
jgi:hypothetical protein